MGGEADGIESRDESGDEIEDPDFKADGERGGKPEPEKTEKMRSQNARRVKSERVPPAHADEKKRRQIDSREDGGESGTLNAHPGSAEAAINKDPVSAGVDEIGRDERPGDGADVVNSLQVTPKNSIEEQERQAPDQNLDEAGGLTDDGRFDAYRSQQRSTADDQRHERQREAGREDEAGAHSPARFRHIARSIGMRDESVETRHEAEPEDRKRVKQRAADAGGADGERAVRQAADHDGVDDAHGHPAEFSESERQGDPQHGADIAQVCAPGRHSFSLGGG